MTSKKPEFKYVIVRHSAYGYAGDLRFQYGLETRSVSGKEIERAKKAGALVYDTYVAAEDAAEDLMYPSGYSGMTPVAHLRGRFGSLKFDGLAVFIPNTVPSPILA